MKEITILDIINFIMKNLWYKSFNSSILRQNAKKIYQKKVIDKKWIKYFINFFFYEDNFNWKIKYSLESNVQFYKNDNITVDVNIHNIILNNKTNDEIINQIKLYENEYEKIYKKMWYNYYE